MFADSLAYFYDTGPFGLATLCALGATTFAGHLDTVGENAFGAAECLKTAAAGTRTLDTTSAAVVVDQVGFRILQNATQWNFGKRTDAGGGAVRQIVCHRRYGQRRHLAGHHRRSCCASLCRCSALSDFVPTVWVMGIVLAKHSQRLRHSTNNRQKGHTPMSMSDATKIMGRYDSTSS